MTPPVPVFAGGVLVHLSELKTCFERTLEVNDAVPTRNNWVSDPLLERFLRYARIDTQSDEASADAPSTARQLVLAEMLKGELQALGLEADIGRGGIVYAHVPATAGAESAPAIGFIAHMDTSPDAPGANVKPQVLRYAGGDVVLNAEKGIVLSVERFPELKRYSGEQVVFTDGTTLLGADDKAGIAAIMGMLDHLREHPEIPHAKLSIAFTPDEEVGRGTENFDHARFGATYAYTFDGGELGELESENFNAASALVTIRGVGVHPGSAKGKMVNALRLAAKFIARLPMAMSPERTEAREGFIHPNNLEGTVVEAKLHLLVRDHDREAFEEKKAFLRSLVKELNAECPQAEATVEIRDSYENMRAYIDRAPKVLELAREAFRRAGVTPVETPIRGGTDGAKLSAEGLPCPNIFTGGLNYHGIYECLPVASLLKARDVAVALAALSADVQSLD